MGSAAITPLLETRAHVEGDRDFLLGFLRDLVKAAKRMREFPGDDEALVEFCQMMTAVEAFVEENNIQAARDAA